MASLDAIIFLVAQPLWVQEPVFQNNEERSSDDWDGTSKVGRSIKMVAIGFCRFTFTVDACHNTLLFYHWNPRGWSSGAAHSQMLQSKLWVCK